MGHRRIEDGGVMRVGEGGGEGFKDVGRAGEGFGRGIYSILI